MDKHLILTIISDDKPGVIKKIAQIVNKHGGNWLESQLSQLAGKFAGVIRLSAPEDNIKEIESALTQLSEFNIQIQLEELVATNTSATKRSAHFAATGPDRQGIVLEITEALTECSINVDNLTTKCSSAPYSGEPLFEIGGTLNLPMILDLEQLKEQLDHIADNLGIDFDLEEAVSV